MYSPDQADIDPANPANFPDSTIRYIIGEYRFRNGRVSIVPVLTEEFEDEAEAKAAMLAIKEFSGEEISLIECDEDGDRMVCACAFWDADKGCYSEE